MTTVAWDGVTLAVDSGSTAAYKTRVCKVHQCADGTMLAFTGETAKMLGLWHWFDTTGGDPEERPECFDDTVTMLEIKPDGTVWHHEKDGCFQVLDPVYALGTGCQIAIGALDAGATAEEAVEIACLRDPGSLGPVVTLTLPDRDE